MRPSQILQKRREEIRRIILAHDAVNPRVFGSVARGEDTEQSDLDVLVDPVDGKTSLITLIRLKRALESALGVKADVLTPLSINERYRDRVLKDARAI
ncbi:MAG: nucleotidyltransferase family protein [Fluviibacter phosphoraccumulans]